MLTKIIQLKSGLSLKKVDPLFGCFKDPKELETFFKNKTENNYNVLVSRLKALGNDDLISTAYAMYLLDNLSVKPDQSFAGRAMALKLVLLTMNRKELMNKLKKYLAADKTPSPVRASVSNILKYISTEI